jgi:hypothetical protein
MRFFERYAKCHVDSLSFYRGPVGEPGGASFAGTFERQEKYIWVPFWTQRPLGF